MKRIFAVGLTAALAGCAGSNQQANHGPNVDAESIAEAPMPEIEPATYIAAGDLAASRNQFLRAAGQYEAALKMHSDDAATTRKLALVYVKANHLPDAVNAWQRYVKVSHGSDEAYGSLGYAYELSAKPADAEKTYQQGIAANPEGPLAHINYGLMLVRRNDVDGAVKQMSAVLKPPEVNYNIASVYSQVGRPDLAQFYYKRALECDPGFVPARQKLSMAE